MKKRANKLTYASTLLESAAHNDANAMISDG